MSILIWAVALAVTAAAATVQGMVGVGFGMAAVPILSLLHPDLAPVPQLLIALPLTVAMAMREWRAAELRGAGWIIVGRLPGALLGVFLLGIATERMLDTIIGLIVLGAVVVVGTGYHIARTTAAKLAGGTISGITGVVASIGGPPVALLYARDESDTIRATLAVVFFFGSVTSVFFRWVSGNITMTDVRVAAVLLPAALAGLWLSSGINDRVPEATVRRGILIVSGVAATVLIVRAAVG
ncbi:MAG: sulfite exporter TauE/SafE family protein [Acidimicrobiia bacterium]